MGHKHNLGSCERCGVDVVTVMGTKEHVIGDIRRSDVHTWRGEGHKLGIA